MPVGKEYALQSMLVFTDVGNVRYHYIDTEHLIFGEHQPRIEYEHLLVHFNNVHVFGNLADTAKGDYLYICLFFFGCTQNISS